MAAELIESLKDDELLNEVIGEGFWKKIKYYPTTTREESAKNGPHHRLDEIRRRLSRIWVSNL